MVLGSGRNIDGGIASDASNDRRKNAARVPGIGDIVVSQHRVPFTVDMVGRISLRFGKCTDDTGAICGRELRLKIKGLLSQ